MEASRIQAVLQDLISQHQRSLLPRLLESTVFVDAHAAGELGAVRRMAAEHGLDEQRLAELLIGHGGLPGPRTCEITSADFHFVCLDTLLPRVLVDQERLAARFDEAASLLDEVPGTAQGVREIAHHHRAAAEYLRSLTTPAAG
ncbi:MAG: hypothetical protein GY778_02240 [bacterium]|nr:hypothetical protein [bacterium]